MADTPSDFDSKFNENEKRIDQGIKTTTILIVVFVVFGVLMTLAVLFYMYRHYRKGQNMCEALYPGSSLKDLRAREECKDRKRSNWSVPSAALLI